MESLSYSFKFSFLPSSSFYSFPMDPGVICNVHQLFLSKSSILTFFFFFLMLIVELKPGCSEALHPVGGVLIPKPML